MALNDTGSGKFKFRYGDESRGLATPHDLRLRRIGEIAKRRANLKVLHEPVELVCEACHIAFPAKGSARGKKKHGSVLCEECTMESGFGRGQILTLEAHELDERELGAITRRVPRDD